MSKFKREDLIYLFEGKAEELGMCLDQVCDSLKLIGKIYRGGW